MDLIFLRKLVNDYSNTWSLRKSMYGVHPKVIEIQVYLDQFKNKNNTYILTPADLFDLIKIIASPSDFYLISLIKEKFDSYFLKNCFDLYNADLLNKNNFQKLYQFKPGDHWLITSSISLLIKKNLLQRAVVRWFEEGQAYLSVFLQMLQMLDKIDQLNQSTLNTLMQSQALSRLPDLLELFISSKIQLDNDFFDHVACYPNFMYLNEVSNMLGDPVVRCLNKDNIHLLLGKHFIFYIQVIPIFKNLYAGKLLNQETFTLICNFENLCKLDEILKILVKGELLVANDKLIHQLLTNELDCNLLRTIILYLDRGDILKQTLLEACIRRFNSAKSLRDEQIEAIIRQLNDKNIFLSEKIFLDFLFISENNMNRFTVVYKNLQYLRMLNQASFEAALQRVSVTFGRIDAVNIEKKSRKETGLMRSEIIIDSMAPSFFIEHGKRVDYDKGGFSTVKKGYASVESNEPVYSIKRLQKKPDPQHEVRPDPQREVRYHRLLGRQAFWYSRKEKLTVVTEWQRETTLSEISSGTLKAESYAKRLQCLVTGLGELNTLHSYYSVHGDIKPNNCVVDLKQGELKLIDFGSARKWGMSWKEDSEEYSWTPDFCDPKLHFSSRYSFWDDVYSMGIVTAWLFPDLFNLYFDKIQQRFEVSIIDKRDLTLVEQAIIALVSYMMEPKRNRRCTSQDALQFSNALLANIECLNEGFIQTITDAYIHRSQMTVEDVLRTSRGCKMHY